MRRGVKLVLVLLGLVLAALALGERPGRRGWRPPTTGEEAVTVYVIYNAFHSDLVVPAEALRAHGAGGATVAATARLKPSSHLAIGWGDMRFYRGQGLGPDRALDLLRVAVWPGNATTVHLQRSGDPRLELGDWSAVRLRLAPADFTALVRRIDAAFALRNGQPIAPADAVLPDEIFFHGVGTASILNDCNHWIGDLVGAAGAPHNRTLDATSWGLALDLRLRGGAVRDGSRARR
jgi:hypothetical protein